MRNSIPKHNDILSDHNQESGDSWGPRPRDEDEGKEGQRGSESASGSPCYSEACKEPAWLGTEMYTEQNSYIPSAHL